MFRISRPFQTLLLSVYLIGTGAAWAQPKPATVAQPPAAPPAAQPQPPKSNPSTLPDSVRRMEKQTGGEVLRAEPMQRDGREVYRLKVLTADGRVRVVQDDPNKHDSGARPASNKEKDKDNSSSTNSDGDPPQN